MWQLRANCLCMCVCVLLQSTQLFKWGPGGLGKQPTHAAVTLMGTWCKCGKQIPTAAVHVLHSAGGTLGTHTFLFSCTCPTV